MSAYRFNCNNSSSWWTQGASQSTLNSIPVNSEGFQGSVSLTGFGGNITVNKLMKPLTVTLGNQTLFHSFVFCPQCPVNLLGRDLLCQFCPLIKVTPMGLLLILPDGTEMWCTPTPPVGGQFTVLTAEEGPTGVTSPKVVVPMADIYWLEVDTSSPTWAQVQALLNDWGPWIRSVAPGLPPSDPYHVTLYYDRMEDEQY